VSSNALNLSIHTNTRKARGIRNQDFPTKLRLTYFQDKSLTLDLSYQSEDQWTNCFTLGPDVKIPSVAYLGFSAETGELADNHDIVSVQTKNLYAPAAGSAAPGNDKGRSWGGSKHKEKSGGGGWLWMFVKFCIFGCVLVAAYAGFVAWRNQRGRSRF
jgi:mannose-binding lectin 2